MTANKKYLVAVSISTDEGDGIMTFTVSNCTTMQEAVNAARKGVGELKPKKAFFISVSDITETDITEGGRVCP